jgi:hypothetical protein
VSTTEKGEAAPTARSRGTMRPVDGAGIPELVRDLLNGLLLARGQT